MKPPRQQCRGGFVFPFVTETLRTKNFSTKVRRYGCFSLTDMVATMNSGNGIRESIRLFRLNPSMREDV
jgi:hypothetical protein